MHSARLQTTFLCALLAVACGQSSDGGEVESVSNYCKTACKVLSELCDFRNEGDFNPPYKLGDTCEEQCSNDTSQKTLESQLATEECFKSAATCDQSQSCPTLLVGAPVNPTGGGFSSGGGVDTGTLDVTSTGGTGSHTNLVKTICERSAECNVYVAGDAGRQINQCFSGLSAFLDPLQSIISEGAEQCIAGASCNELDNEEKVPECTGLDPDKGYCASATTMEVCNTSGDCANVDCAKFCTVLNPGSEGWCKFSESKGRANCSCTENIAGGFGSSSPRDSGPGD
jgi:hypothetical protein